MKTLSETLNGLITLLVNQRTQLHQLGGELNRDNSELLKSAYVWLEIADKEER